MSVSHVFGKNVQLIEPSKSCNLQNAISSFLDFVRITLKSSIIPNATNERPASRNCQNFAPDAFNRSFSALSSAAILAIFDDLSVTEFSIAFSEPV